MRKTIQAWLIILVWGLAACGLAEPDVPDGTSATVDTDWGSEKGDSPPSWQVKSDSLTMWVDTLLVPQVVGGTTSWLLRGRVSKTMSGFRAYTASGYHFDGKMVSARKFEVILSAEEALEVVAGERLYFDFFAKRGAIPMYHAMARFAPRFANWGGSSSIFVFRSVNPIWMGSQLKFRGRAKTRPGFELQLVYTDDDAGPMLFEDVQPRTYYFDWSPAALHLAADPTEDLVYFRGSDVASTPIEKTASLEFRLVQMGLGTEPPLEAWPAKSCDGEVRACLESLNSPDTQICGWANDVGPCLEEVELPPGADRERFVSDLREAVSAWHTSHPSDVRAMNGRTLEAALAQISSEAAGEVTDPIEVDLLGYSLDHVQVFHHPDPIFRDSIRIWYGIYDRAGTLLMVEAVN